MTMKAKYIIAAVLILAAGFEVYRIEKRFSAVTLELTKKDRATVKVSELPEASTFDGTDLFVVADGGTVSRKLTGAKIAGAISDTADALRAEMLNTLTTNSTGTTNDSTLIVGASTQQSKIQAYREGDDYNTILLSRNGDNETYFGTTASPTDASSYFSTTDGTNIAELVMSPTAFTFSDTIRASYVLDNDSLGWAYWSKANGLGKSRVTAASWGLTSKLQALPWLLKERLNGEIKWEYAPGKYTYKPDTLQPGIMISMLIADSEKDKRRMMRMQLVISLLVISNIVLFIKMRKK